MRAARRLSKKSKDFSDSLKNANTFPPLRGGKVLTWLLVVFMVLNMAVSALAFGRYVERSTVDAPAQNIVTEFLDEHYPDERIERVYPSAKFVG